MDFVNINTAVRKYSCRQNGGLISDQDHRSMQANVQDLNDIACDGLNSDLSFVNKINFMLIFIGVE